MPSSRQMTDEQRRAMFARLHGGSGGGSSGTAYDDADDDYDPVAFAEYQRQFYANLHANERPVWKEFLSGAAEGAGHGVQIAVNDLTHGLTDKLGWTDAETLVREGGTAYAVADLLGTVSSALLETALLQGAGAELSAAAALHKGEAALAGIRGLQAAVSVAEGMEAFRGGDAIDAFRQDRYLNPDLDKALAVVGEAADIYGGYQLAAGFGKLVGALRAIPAGSQTVGDFLDVAAKAAGDAVSKPFAALWQTAENALPKTSEAVKTAYDYYSRFSEITGGGLTDLLSKGKGLVANVTGALMLGRATAESVITRKTEKYAKAAFEAGKPYTIAAATPRGAAGTALAATVGTTGNPIEKMTRKGAWTPAQEEGVYRAKVDVVQDAYKSGQISADERDSLLKQVATEKPRNMAGNSLYGVQSAMSKFFQWKGGEAASALGSSTLARIQSEDRASAKAQKEAEKAEKARAAAEREEAAKVLSAAFGVSPVETSKGKKTADASDTSTFNTINQWLGSGLMYTGHTGVLSPMGEAGTGIAQTWNAALAVLGAVDYNNRAAKSHDKTYTSPLQSQKPAAQKTEQQAAEEILRAAFGL